MASLTRTTFVDTFVQSFARLHIPRSAATGPIRYCKQSTSVLRPGRALFSTASARSKQDSSDSPAKAKRLHQSSISKREMVVKAKKEVTRPGRPASRVAEPVEDWEPPKRETWQMQKEALKNKFPEGWRPKKRLSPDAMAGIRALHAQFPDEYNTQTLADKFRMSPEAIRRILKSKWTPSPDEEVERQERWFRRGKTVWARYADQGMKPPQKWRKEGVTRDPSYHESRRRSVERRKKADAEEDDRKPAAQVQKGEEGAGEPLSASDRLEQASAA